MSVQKTRQELLITNKKKYATGNYIIVSGKHVIREPNWECFDLQETYVHKKDKKVLEAFLKDFKVKIEYYIGFNSHQDVWNDFCLDFLEDYDEDYKYRLKEK